MVYTFKGGIRPDNHKYTSNVETVPVQDPPFVSISLSQHIGVMCKPLVKVGDHVLEGQLIGDVFSKPGCPVHASVSGVVRRIEEVTTSSGGTSFDIVIENDRLHTLSPNVRPFGKKLSEATFEEICAVIRNAGIIGMGGVAFPTHMKLSAARGRVDTVFINCTESEPFICSTHRLILETPKSVVNGAKILMMALGVKDAVFAVNSDRKDEIKALTEAFLPSDKMAVTPVTPKYPSGSEKQLIYALTKLEVPSTKNPIDLGCIVFNADTCAAVYYAFSKGMPLIRRNVTVDGDCISSPANYSVPVGTPVSHLIDCCDGLCNKPKKVILGGPMRGNAVWDVNSPVTKTTSAVLVFSDYFDRESKLPPTCINCGRCVDVCPMGLMPNKIALYSKRGSVKKSASYGAQSCIECGSCTYVCPGGMPVAQLVARTKLAIQTERRKSETDESVK